MAPKRRTVNLLNLHQVPPARSGSRSRLGSQWRRRTNAKKTKFAKPDPGMTAKNSRSQLRISLFRSAMMTGSYGWKASHKIQVKVNVNGEEKEVQVQVGINMTVSGSKPDVKKPTNGKEVDHEEPSLSY
ncbi:hypothetical protein H4Q26_011363 [Puccinia striiformis f. sp. tritici PST-130]|nr:hypothetical protein H4Q26_011363 [Puccinia striiformis f. sp. tritici PST-130]